ncbi:hypothetical protein SpCBS45565_g02423 [Spizellomyces sp. 'palustris']|nr:hypothetical protein SpCBS45565_g02423 [Spizellomyces sp. 'palustris']
MSDIERQRAEKVREVTGALKEGRLPTTAQAVSGIQQIQQGASLGGVSKDLSPAGKKVLADTERLLDDTKKVITQTMPNNELQNAIYYGGLAAQRSQPLSASEASTAADQLVQAGAKAAQLAKMIVTSGEFRSLLSEISEIAQEIARSNIDEASDDLANDPNAPEQVRDAAARTRETVRNNDLQGAAQQGSQQAQATYEQGKQQAYNTANEQSRKAQEAGDATRRTAGDSLAGGATLRDTAKNLVDTIANQAERHLPEDTVNKTSGAIRDHGAKLHTGEESATGLKNQAVEQGRTLANQAASQLRDPNSQLRQTGERVARKLVDMPEDKRRDIILRVKVVAKTLQSKPEFQGGIDDLFDILAPLGWQAKTAASVAISKTAEAPTDPNQLEASREARIATANAKQLIENFANGRSLDPLIVALQGFAGEAREDQELRAFWNDFGAYLRRTIREPGYIEQANYDREAEELVERGRRALDKYNYHTQKISYESRNYAQALASNKTTQRMQSDANALVNDLFLDERGKPTFKPELLRDLAKCIPAIADKLAYLPIPRVEVDDGTYHLIFDNIILHSTILPKYVHIVTDTTVDATKKDPNEQFNNYILLEISQIEASARDIAWLFNKHSGFWKAGDVGLADFDIKGDGLSIRVKIIPGAETGRAAPNDDVKGRFLHAAEVETTLHNLDLRLHDSHHDFLYKIAKPILQSRAKKQIEQAVSDSLRDLIFSLDEKVAQAANQVAPVGGPEPAKGIPEWGSKAFNA